MPYTPEEIEGMTPVERVRIQDKIALQYLEKKDKKDKKRWPTVWKSAYGKDPVVAARERQERHFLKLAANRKKKSD